MLKFLRPSCLFCCWSASACSRMQVLPCPRFRGRFFQIDLSSSSAKTTPFLLSPSNSLFIQVQTEILLEKKAYPPSLQKDFSWVHRNVMPQRSMKNSILSGPPSIPLLAEIMQLY